MNSSYYLIFIIILIVLMEQEKNQKITIYNKIKHKKNPKEKLQMEEMAKTFINKRCMIHLINTQVVGFIKEVNNGAILISYKEKEQILNLDYILKIEVYPEKKKAKAC